LAFVGLPAAAKAADENCWLALPAPGRNILYNGMDEIPSIRRPAQTDRVRHTGYAVFAGTIKENLLFVNSQ